MHLKLARRRADLSAVSAGRCRAHSVLPHLTPPSRSIARSSASRNTMRTSQARNRERSLSRSNRRYARSNASCATSSASAALRNTPRATRNANGPHSASRSSNSRRTAAAAAAFASASPDQPVRAALVGWVRASSRMNQWPSQLRSPPCTATRRHHQQNGSLALKEGYFRVSSSQLKTRRSRMPVP